MALMLHEKDIDLVHCRIRSIEALRLERFSHVEVRYAPKISGRQRRSLTKPPLLQKLCLRQNNIQDIDHISSLRETLQDLDLYDNLISQIEGLDELVNLTSLDLSFNKIKRIKNVSHLTLLTDLYFVQNKISRIEGLEGLQKIKNLELAANRIRVCLSISYI